MTISGIKEEVDGVIAQINTRLRNRLKVMEIPLTTASTNAGLHGQYLSKVFGGNISPAFENIVAICVANNVDLIDILVDENISQKVKSLKTISNGLPGQKEELTDILFAAFRQRNKDESE